MKKNNIILLLLLFSVDLIAQNQLVTNQFILKGDYKEIEKTNHKILGYDAVNYTFFSANGKEFYQLGVVIGDNKGFSYLEKIKNSDPRYSVIQFQNVKGISSEREVMSEGSMLYIKDIMFFKNNNSFSVLLIVENKRDLAPLFAKFMTSFKAK